MDHHKAETKLKDCERKASKAIVREIDANEKFSAEAAPDFVWISYCRCSYAVPHGTQSLPDMPVRSFDSGGEGL
jgi:hypothetical protein